MQISNSKLKFVFRSVSDISRLPLINKSTLTIFLEKEFFKSLTKILNYSLTPKKHLSIYKNLLEFHPSD